MPSQRERLYAATVTVVAEKGYEASRVADLITAAGVSRNTFYREFDDKHDCICATIDAAVDFTAARVVAAYRQRRGDCSVRLGGAFEALIDVVVDHPAAAKLCCVDAYVVGPKAVERAARLDRLLEQIVTDAVNRSNGTASAAPPEAVRAILGGLKQVIHSRVRRGRADELQRLAPELLEWSLGYAAPAGSELPTLRLPTGEADDPMEPAAPAAGDARERMHTAVAELTLAKGYSAMTITEIADRARVSLTTFYKHHSSKEEAFLAAASHGEQLILAETLPAYQSAPDWPSAVQSGLRAFLRFLAANPAYARLGLLDAYSGSPTALDWREKSVARFQALMIPGYDLYPGTPAIVAEAVGAAIGAVLYQDLTVTRDTRRLPELAPLVTFLALAPFLGPRDAMAVVATPEPAR